MLDIGKEGLLSVMKKKKSMLGGHWKERFVILNKDEGSTRLSYHQSKADPIELYAVLLEGAKTAMVREDLPQATTGTVFVVHAKAFKKRGCLFNEPRSFYFRCSSNSVAESWVFTVKLFLEHMDKEAWQTAPRHDGAGVAVAGGDRSNDGIIAATRRASKSVIARVRRGSMELANTLFGGRRRSGTAIQLEAPSRKALSSRASSSRGAVGSGRGTDGQGSTKTLTDVLTEVLEDHDTKGSKRRTKKPRSVVKSQSAPVELMATQVAARAAVASIESAVVSQVYSTVGLQ